MDQNQQRTEVQDQNKRPRQYSRQEIITDQTQMLLVETRRTGLALRDKVWWPGSKPGILSLLVVTGLCNPLHYSAGRTQGVTR